jgi:hypothetical protein
MYASTLLLIVPVIIGRFFVVQSPSWLASRGWVDEAETRVAACADFDCYEAN